MKPQVARLVNAFVITTEADRSAAMEIIQSIASASELKTQSDILESIGLEDSLRAALSLGPFPGPCPTC